MCSNNIMKVNENSDKKRVHITRTCNTATTAMKSLLMIAAITMLLSDDIQAFHSSHNGIIHRRNNGHDVEAMNSSYCSLDSSRTRIGNNLLCSKKQGCWIKTMTFATSSCTLLQSKNEDDYNNNSSEENEK